MAANHVTLSSGQVLFSDPTKPWSPTNFPNLPSTNISFTTTGTIETRNISTISFSNAITYKPYEHAAQDNLQKSFLMNRDGSVVYDEPRVGVASTLSAPFMDAQVAGFAPAAAGAPGIQDVNTASPDTVTNALAKLDAWITNAFLLQPPGITPIASETNSIYGGVRWLNFNSYTVMDQSVPYVSGIVFIIGDPATPNYCTFEFKDCNYFPYKTYRDGLSPNYTPLVRLRIFSDCFVPTANQIYTKAVMQTKCVRLISESGAAAFPAHGKCFAIEDTDAETTYTTISIYLPNLASAYPKGSPVPVRIAYLNKSDGNPTVTYTSTVQATTGSPGPVSSITALSATPTTVTLQLGKPTYVDTLANLSTPFLSSYQVNYTIKEMASAHADGIGFRYGIPIPTTLPTEFASYINSTFHQQFTYTAPLQSVTVGTTQTGLLPGAVWSTSAIAYNCAKLPGPNTAGPLVSTLFPVDSTPNISSMALKAATPDIRTANSGTLKYMSYSPSGWSIGQNVSTDVLFLSTIGNAVVQTSTLVQWNDRSYPGDRSTFTVRGFLSGAEAAVFHVSSVNQDFPTETLSTMTGANELKTTITDSQTALGYDKYFYNASIEASVQVNTISLVAQSAQISLEQHVIPSYTGTIATRELSSQIYYFQTEPVNPTVTTDIVFNNRVTSTTQIAGLYTPSPSSEFFFEIQGSNVAYNFAGANFARAAVMLDNTSGPQTTIASNVYILDGATPVTTLPLPQNTILRFSTASAFVGPNLYNDPNDPKPFKLAATLTPANPQTVPAAYVSTLTSNVFVDTVSYGTFADPSSSNGLRIMSQLPRPEIAFTEYNILDDVGNTGAANIGLNVNLSTLYTVDSNSEVLLDSSLTYQHTSSLSTLYTSFYSRELLFTNATFVHPAGYNLSAFDGAYIGVPSAVYPDFTYDQIYDLNYGYRYATFAISPPLFDPPASYLYLNIRLHNVSGTGTVGASRSANNYFPDAPVDASLVAQTKVRMHAKLVGAHISETFQTYETAWLNCFKQVSPFQFTDDAYDIGACDSVIMDGADVVYKIQINRRFYQKMCAFIRVGIAQDGSQYSGSPITFQSITITPSDI